MATVNRPPFWVPRPPDDNIWQWVPPRGALTLTLQEQKFFGAPGQVPTKRWWPHYLYDDAAVWVGPLIEWMNSGALQLTNTQVKFFGQNGQAPTKKWAPQYTYDDPPPWQFDANWMTSSAIQLLSQPKMFGAGGQVPPSRWNFNYDDAAPWQFDTNWMNSGIIQNLSHQVMFGAGGQVVQFRPNFTYDDPPPWQPDVNQLNSAIVQILSAAGKPPVPRFWSFNYDETSPWQPAIETLNSSILQILSAAGKPFSVRFRYDVDDAAVWQGAPIAMSALHLPQQATTKPFANPYQQRFNYDETAPWSFWQPYATNVTFTLSSFIEYSPRSNWQQFIINYHETAAWQWTPQRNDVVLQPAATAKPFSNRQIFWYSEDAVWQGAPVGANINFLPQVTYVPRSPFWAIRPAEEQVWQGAPIAVSALHLPVAPPVNVLNVYRWWFNYDDAPMWQGAPVRSNPNFLPTITYVPRAPFWSLRPGFDTEWVGAPRGVFIPPTPLPPVNVLNVYRWWFNYDDSAVWQGKPIASNPQFLTAPPKPFVTPPWSFHYDETPPWDFWGPYANNATFTAASFVEYAPRSNWQSQVLSVDDQPIWVGTPLNASTLYLPIAPPPPVVLPPAGGGKRRKTKAQIAREQANAALVAKAKQALSPGDAARANIALAKTKKPTFGPVRVSMAELRAVLDALDEDDEEA